MSRPLYFTVKTQPKTVQELEALYGAFDENDLSVADRSDPDVAKAKMEEYHQSLLRKGFKDPAAGRIIGIAYLGGQENLQLLETGDEQKLLSDFWMRYNQGSETFSGWGIIERDLHWIKARSWANGVTIPPAAIRTGFNGRSSWHRIKDLQRELAGGPVSLNRRMVMRSFGMSGEVVPDEIMADGIHGNPDTMTSLVVAELSDARSLEEKLQPSTEKSPTGLSDKEVDEIANGYLSRAGEAGFALPITWDIETAPGEISKLKEVMGEFDPSKVKLGAMKDPVKIRAKLESAAANYDQDLLEKSQVDPYLGRISAIGLKLLGSEPLILGHSQRDQLRIFWKMRELSKGRWQGWNINDFDLEWVKVKSFMEGLGCTTPLRRPSQNGYEHWEKFTDLEVEWTGSPNACMPLHAVAVALGLEGKNGNGADFYRDFESPDPDKRLKGKNYLIRDVEQEEGVGLRMGFGAPELELAPSVAKDLVSITKRIADLSAAEKRAAEFE